MNINRRLHRLTGTVFLALTLSASGVASAQADPARIVAELQRALDADVAASPSLPGELLHVHAPSRGLDTTLAAGVFDRESGRALGPRDGFRVASVTKTFTAASILRLHELGRLNVDDAVARHLAPEHLALLRADGYDPDAITLRHLLTHTSGIHDYATDERYFAAVLADPAHRWTALEQVRSAMAWGEPHFAPGAGYHYSDTGYLLLAAIIERHTGQPLAAAFRTLLRYDRLGLDETYLESLEPAPAGAGELSHPHLGEMDAMGLDPSVDLYGGGGLVSSAQDLARFYRALLRGEVFDDGETLRMMLSVPATNQESPGGPYAMGIQRTVIGGQACWGHTGFWGTAAHHCPGPDVTIVRHTNQAQPDEAFIYRRLYDAVADALAMRP